MSAACKTILKTLHARGAKPPPGARRMAATFTRMFYARRNWPTLLRDGIRLVAKPQRKPQFPEAAFQAHGRPRHLPILGPLLGGRQFIALASIAIRPLALDSGASSPASLQATPIRQAESSQVVRAGARHEAVFIANCAARRNFWVCGLAAGAPGTTPARLPEVPPGPAPARLA